MGEMCVRREMGDFSSIFLSVVFCYCGPYKSNYPLDGFIPGFYFAIISVQLFWQKRISFITMLYLDGFIVPLFVTIVRHPR